MLNILPFFTLFQVQMQDDLIGIIGGVIAALFGLVLSLVMLIAMWKVYTKAGKPGWAVIIPIYNVLVMLEIVGRPWWWLLLMLIPLVNVVVAFVLAFDIAKSFGKGSGFALGLIFFNVIFFLILGFGKADYVGPSAAS